MCVCVCVCVCCFFFFLQYVRVWRCKKCELQGGFAVDHCTASHCIGLYKEVTSKWPKSPFALIYRDGVGGERDAGRWSKSKVMIAGKKRLPLLLHKLLALFFYFFFPVFKVLFWSFCLISLDCGSCCCFCWSIISARNRGSAQMCVNVAFACVACIAANCLRMRCC